MRLFSASLLLLFALVRFVSDGSISNRSPFEDQPWHLHLARSLLVLPNSYTMHLSTFALPIALSAVTTIVFASPVAPPQLQSAEPANSRYKRALDDLTLKVKYPELFKPNAKRAEPSHQVCTQDCPGYANSPVTCRYVPGAGRRKRSVTDPDVVMLRPEDAARYFLGRGRYTT